MTFYFGLDLGQAADPTALAILESLAAKGGGETMYHGRHIERFKLGTSYPNIVTGVKQRVIAANVLNDYIIVADATGVGRPVVDLLTAAGLKVAPVTITGGAQWNRDPDGMYHVPKRDLVSTLQVLLQSGRLKFAERLPEVPILIKELLNFQVKITTSANDTYGAWREGLHDDLVLACSLAAWYGVHGRRKTTVLFEA